MKKKVILFWAMFFINGLEANVNFNCPKNCCTKVFSIVPQCILPGEPILLEKSSAQSCDIDLSLASGFGIISFNRSGVYKIIWSGEACSFFNLSWTLGFSLDGTILLGNVYGPSSHHPSTTEKFEGSIVLSINAGQALRFVNASSHRIELTPNKTSSPPQPSFTVCLSLFDIIEIFNSQYQSNF